MTIVFLMGIVVAEVLEALPSPLSIKVMIYLLVSFYPWKLLPSATFIEIYNFTQDSPFDEELLANRLQKRLKRLLETGDFILQMPQL